MCTYPLNADVREETILIEGSSNLIACLFACSLALMACRISSNCKGSWSYGPITVLLYLSLSIVPVNFGVHLRYLGFIWFTIRTLSTAHPSLHSSLVIRRPE